MNREEIIKLAREAGLFVPHEGIPENGAFMRFATTLLAKEREECAKVCEDNADFCNRGSPLHTILSSNAAAIRAKGD